MRQRLIAIHLLNDFSGSPLVLKESLEALKEGFEVHLYTATPAGKGVLSSLSDVKFHPVFYKWHRSKLITLIFFLMAQAGLFVTLLFSLRGNDIVYINTLLPFGAALAARVRGVKVVYHIHEVSIRPALLKKILVWVARRVAARVFFVSVYVRDHFGFPPAQSEVIYNALPQSFIEKAATMAPRPDTEPFCVLMLCSLKEYKGVLTFLRVARELPDLKFIMVLNTSPLEVDRFSLEHDVPKNCEVYAAQEDTLPFYQRAAMVVNLSLPDKWVETFGLTVLEGMYCGRPVVVPPLGGITELIQDGVEGFKADARNTEEVVEKISLLANDPEKYSQFARSARKRAQRFSSVTFRTSVLASVQRVIPAGHNFSFWNNFPENGINTAP